MKKLTSLVLALALGLSLVACGASADTSAPADDSADTTAAEDAATDAEPTEAPADDAAEPADDAAAGEFTTVEEGVLVMSTNAAFPPYEMTTDGEGVVDNFVGIDVEVANEIAKKLGLTLRVDDMDFDAALLAAQTGKSDIVMAGVTVTDERLAVMDFSDSYAKGVQSIIVPEGSDITSVDDLYTKAEEDGFMIGVQRGTTGNIYCEDDFGQEHVDASDNGMTAVQKLQNGQVDCVVIDNAPAQELVAANEGLTILDTNYTEEDYAIGVAKGNTALLDAINGAMAELKADGTFDAIVAKYISAE